MAILFAPTKPAVPIFGRASGSNSRLVVTGSALYRKDGNSAPIALTSGNYTIENRTAADVVVYRDTTRLFIVGANSVSDVEPLTTGTYYVRYVAPNVVDPPPIYDTSI